MPPKVKIKNDTSEMIAEIARRMDLPVREIQNEFHMYWQDVSIMMTYCLGHSFLVDNLGTFILNVRCADKLTRTLEKKLKRRFEIMSAYRKYEAKHSLPMLGKTEALILRIADDITRIILLDCSIKAYEIEVRSQYPKKYKPQVVYLKKYIPRLEKHIGMALSKFPVQISSPLQEVFVRGLQQKGLLPNPVVYKSKKV